MYSSIEEDDRRLLLRKCYWPILNIADMGFPIGIEASGQTLEIINRLDSNWIQTLKKQIKEKKVEFIGSGYSQLIGPLVPAVVNDWNQKLGLQIYKNLLGVRPNIALVNEMAYSSGIVEHYLNHGYNCIVMEWNNPRKYHPEWPKEWRFFPQKVVETNGQRKIPLIWADSIAFQKFQRYAHNEYKLEEYADYLKSHISNQDRFVPLYTNDAEIFDFRPGRYSAEAKIGNQSEWERIQQLFQFLEKQKWAKLTFPSKALDGLSHPDGGNEIRLESAEQPIPVKKQEKYNINRWATTGRDDLYTNTSCYRIYKHLVGQGNEIDEDWEKLCSLWASDFRTHITEKRWGNYQQNLKNTLSEYNAYGINNHQQSDFIQLKLPHKSVDLSCKEEDKYIFIENRKIRLVLNKAKGLAIKECVFKEISNQSLFGTLNHGYFEDISLGADYYSGHAIIDRLGKHKITDLNDVTPEVLINRNSILIRGKHIFNKVSFATEIRINNNEISISKNIVFQKNHGQSIIRPLSITFNPEGWEKDTLSFSTHNGGRKLEKFDLTGKKVIHNDIYTSLISARHGMGATEGKLIISDKKKSMYFKNKMHFSALIPSIIYLPQNDGNYFLRLQYSAKELDETVVNPNSRKISLSLEINLEPDVYL